MSSRLSNSRSIHHVLTGNNRYWLRLFITASILLLSAGLAFTASQRQLQLILFLLVGAGVAWVFISWPAVGLLVAYLGGMVLPVVGPAGLNLSMITLGMLLALWLLDMVVQQRKIRLVPSATIRPVVALMVTACFSFAIGQLPWFSFARNAPLDAQVGGLAVFLLSAGAFLLAANQIKDLRWLERITWMFLALAGLYIVGRIVPGVQQLNRFLFQSGAIGGVFWAWLPALAFSQVVFNRNLRPGWRLVLAGLVLASLYVAYANFRWKSGWVPATAGVAAILCLRSWRVGLALGAVAGVLSLGLVPDLLASDAYSVSTRLDAWLILTEIVKVSPLLGLGFANYYWYTPLFSIRGWSVAFNSHNNYIDIVAQTGLAGLVCFLWFCWEIGRLGWQLRERVPEGFAKAYVNGALGGLVATLVAAMLGDWVLPFVYNVGLQGFRTGVLAWLFLGGLVVLQNLYGGEMASATGKVQE